jgi:hypothetical protein
MNTCSLNVNNRIANPDTQTHIDDDVFVNTIAQEDEQEDNPELYAHWVDARKAEKSSSTGRQVVALCGKVWIPKHNADDFPICPKCQDIYESLTF